MLKHDKRTEECQQKLLLCKLLFTSQETGKPDGTTKETYKKIHNTKYSNCLVASPVCISNKSSNQRSYVTSSRPICDIIGCSCIAFTQTFYQIVHHICIDSIVCQSLTALIPCKKNQLWRP